MVGQYMGRLGIPPAVGVEIRRGLSRGQTWKQVAAACGVSVTTVGRVAHDAGGVPPRWKDRSPSQLSIVDREEIFRLVTLGHSNAEIACQLGRHPATISRELNRNGGRDAYRPIKAERRAWNQARRPKACKLAQNHRLAKLVARWLRQRCSPQQIAGRLKRQFPNDPEMQVSHETIYQTLFVQARGALLKELTAYLRSGRSRRRPQSPTATEVRAGKLLNMVNISERPAEVDDRAVPGHWEGDLIIGANGSSAVGTLVERSTRFTILLKLADGRSAAAVREAMAAKILTLPRALRRSITWDQGKEMAEHVQFTIDTGIQIYFCDPRSPWQRGTNENTNGLLRQYMPKGTSLARFSESDLDNIADELNGRPRRALDFMTPSEAFNQLVALTA